MKRRYVYLLLFGPPAVLASAAGALSVFGGAAGIAWLFFFGDDHWPAWGEAVLVAIAIATFIGLLFVLMGFAYAIGRREEGRGPLNAAHVAASLGAFAFLLAVAVYHQFRVGNLGAPHESVVCANFCRGAGFAGSQIPPSYGGARTCICLDTRGREGMSMPIDKTPGHDCRQTGSSPL